VQRQGSFVIGIASKKGSAMAKKRNLLGTMTKSKEEKHDQCCSKTKGSCVGSIRSKDKKIFAKRRLLSPKTRKLCHLALHQNKECNSTEEKLVWHHNSKNNTMTKRRLIDAVEKQKEAVSVALGQREKNSCQEKVAWCKNKEAVLVALCQNKEAGKEEKLAWLCNDKNKTMAKKRKFD